jgi:hypothetical protein
MFKYPISFFDANADYLLITLHFFGKTLLKEYNSILTPRTIRLTLVTEYKILKKCSSIDEFFHDTIPNFMDAYIEDCYNNCYENGTSSHSFACKMAEFGKETAKNLLAELIKQGHLTVQ